MTADHSRVCISGIMANTVSLPLFNLDILQASRMETEVQELKCRNRSTDAQRKDTYQCLVPYTDSQLCVKNLQQR